MTQNTPLQSEQDTHEITSALRSQTVDQFVIDAVIGQYVEGASQSGNETSIEIGKLLVNDEGFRAQAGKAIYDGLMISTLVNVVDDASYFAALSDLRQLKDPLLEQLRIEIFRSGVEVSCLNAGGSPERGRARMRSERFMQHVQAFGA